MKAKPPTSQYDDPMTELAVLDFLFRASRKGRPEQGDPCNKASRRFGNLVTIIGQSMGVSFYRVVRLRPGVEWVRLLNDPSAEDMLRLIYGA